MATSWILSGVGAADPERPPGLGPARKDGTYFKACDGDDDAELTELTGDKAKAVLDKSSS